MFDITRNKHEYTFTLTRLVKNSTLKHVKYQQVQIKSFVNFLINSNDDNLNAIHKLVAKIILYQLKYV